MYLPEAEVWSRLGPRHFAHLAVRPPQLRAAEPLKTLAGYCRAQRIGDRILISGTTATAGVDRAVASQDAGAQTTFILDKITEALAALGAAPEDVIRTRIYLVDEADTLAVSNAHGRLFAEIKPANTLVVVAKLVGNYRVEIEAEALVRG